MPDHAIDVVQEALLRQRALSRWDSDGGAEPAAEPATVSPSSDLAPGQPPMPSIGEAEVQALHVRVIALENLVVGLLMAASDQERESARAMASRIAPRPGFTHHPLTIHAAAHMASLVERATRLLRHRSNG